MICPLYPASIKLDAAATPYPHPIPIPLTLTLTLQDPRVIETEKSEKILQMALKNIIEDH